MTRRRFAMPCSFSSRKTARRYGFLGLLDLRSLAHRFHGLAAEAFLTDIFNTLIFPGALVQVFIAQPFSRELHVQESNLSFPLRNLSENYAEGNRAQIFQSSMYGKFGWQLPIQLLSLKIIDSSPLMAVDCHSLQIFTDTGSFLKFG